MPDSFYRRFGKRGLDLVAGGALLLLLAPLLLGVAAAVWLRLGRPVFYRQQRPGLGGRPFTLYKFRTMRGAYEKSRGTDGDAERITPLGAWLRARSLDELPELWNVVRGDMSLVGPRPLLTHYLSHYTPRQARRHEVRPGVTGWAQVNGRNELPWEARFEHDVWYVERCGLLLDVKILARTIGCVFARKGIQGGDHATMPEFRRDEPPTSSQREAA